MLELGLIESFKPFIVAVQRVEPWRSWLWGNRVLRRRLHGRMRPAASSVVNRAAMMEAPQRHHYCCFAPEPPRIDAGTVKDGAGRKEWKHAGWEPRVGAGRRG